MVQANLWYFFCVLCKSMRNKVIIATFLAFIAFEGFSQIGDKTSITAEQELHYESLNNTNKIQIFPNPAVEYITVEIKNSTLADTQFEMRSIIGTEVKVTPEEIGEGQFRFQIKDFSRGYYFLVVKDEVSRFKKAYRFLKK